MGADTQLWVEKKVKLTDTVIVADPSRTYDRSNIGEFNREVLALRHAEIYQFQAEAYDDMIKAQPCFIKQISKIYDPEGKSVLDLGAGTGRLSMRLAESAQTLVCTDQSAAMLRVLEQKKRNVSLACSWQTIQADHRKLPLPAHSIDLIIAGWSISYLVHSGQIDWVEQLDQIMVELHRVLKPGGRIIILETLGTGAQHPEPPASLMPYYRALEEKYAFEHDWFRGDYHFHSWQDAAQSLTFFFGEELASAIHKHQWAVVPECVGVWWSK